MYAGGGGECQKLCDGQWIHTHNTFHSRSHSRGKNIPFHRQIDTRRDYTGDKADLSYQKSFSSSNDIQQTSKYTLSGELCLSFVKILIFFLIPNPKLHINQTTQIISQFSTIRIHSLKLGKFDNTNHNFITIDFGKSINHRICAITSLRR